MNEDLQSLDMKPRDDGVIRLPYPIDFSARKRNFIAPRKLVLSALVLGLNFMYTLSVLDAYSASIISKVISFGMMFIWTSLFFRFVFFEELYFRRIKETLETTDFTFPLTIIWDVYDIVTLVIDGTEFHVLYYMNGRRGVLVRFIRDTMVGAGEDIEYRHYEALGEALRINALRDSMSIVQLDLMGAIGVDARIDLMYTNLKTPNSELRNVVASIYDNLGEISANSYHESDMYLFIAKRDDDVFYRDLLEVLDVFMTANYINYEIQDRRGIRDTVMALNGVGTFSTVKVCSDVSRGSSISEPAIRLLWLEKDNERITVNDSMGSSEIRKDTTTGRPSTFKQLKTLMGGSAKSKKKR